MTDLREIAILGGGAAGTAAADVLGRAGRDVLLVERGERSARRLTEHVLADLLASRPLAPAPRSRRGEGFRAAVRRAGEAAAAAADRRQRALSRARVHRVLGPARLRPEGQGRLSVGGQDLQARHVVLASGSRPVLPPGFAPGLVECRDGLLDRDQPPESALVVGGGRDGVLLAGLLARAGTRVVLVERADRVLPEADAEISAGVGRALLATGVELILQRRVAGVAAADGGFHATLEGGDAVEVEVALWAAGRRPCLEGLGLEEAGIDVRVPLPPQSHAGPEPWLLLAGSVTGRALTPEAAVREGRAVAGLLLGQPVHVPHAAIPTFVAGAGGGGWVGRTEVGARARGHSLLVGRAPLPGAGPVPPGFIKLIADRGSGRLLGVHVLGAQGREAVSLAAALIELGAGRADLAAMAFPGGTGADALVRAATLAEAD